MRIWITAAWTTEVMEAMEVTMTQAWARCAI